MKQTRNQTAVAATETASVRKSKIREYWDSRGDSKGEIINMQAILK